MKKTNHLMLSNIKSILVFIGVALGGIFGIWFTAKKKGKQQAINDNMRETIKNVQKIKKVDDKVDHRNDDDVIAELRKYTKND